MKTFVAIVVGLLALIAVLAKFHCGILPALGVGVGAGGFAYYVVGLFKPA